ncbi:hypothetical protein ACJX0J_012407, partial [Zea mays]
ARTLQASVQNSSGDGGRFVRRSSPLRSLVQPMRQKPLVDRDGFTLVESCRTQKQRRRLERSFGIQALETFKGWCFKCLSPHHRVALCRSIIRCLLCHTPGHTSYTCPRRLQPYRQQPSFPPVCSRMAGRLRAPVHRLPPVHAAQCSVDAAEGPLPDLSRGRRRRLESDIAVDAGDGVCTEPHFAPTRIIPWSPSFNQRTEVLDRAIVLTVTVAINEAVEEAILDSFARRLALVHDSLSMCRLGPACLLLILPSLEMADRAFDGGRIVNLSPTTKIHVMRWSRTLNSSAAASLPFQVEIEVSGIPAHAWELETVHALLNQWCWIADLHPDCERQREVFKVTAWCSSPGSIPKEFKLEIVDPVTTDGGMLRRSLVYPIRVSVKVLDRPDMLQSLQPSPPPAEDDLDQGRRRRRRRSRRSSFGINAPGKGSTTAVLPRVSVHQRLGPRVQACGKEGVRVPSLAVHKRLGPLGIFNADKGAVKKMKRVWIPKRKLESSVSVWIPKTSSALVSPLPVAVDDAFLEATSSTVVTEDTLAGSPEVIPVDGGICSEAAIISDAPARFPMVESNLQDVNVLSEGVGLPLVESDLQNIHLMESSLSRKHLMSPSLLVYSRKRHQKLQLIDSIDENGNVGAAADAIISSASATGLAADGTDHV